MTDLADVDSLNETATDITKPVVSAKDELRDAEARRRELLQALGNATTEAEADALEAKIADARREIARAEAAYERLTARARLSELSVTVSSDTAASEHRDLGDWLDDAVDVLRTVAGVLLVTLAVVVPIGLIVALAAWVVSRSRRRRRERALDE
jgi:chromosome segregation ATPase